MYHMYADPHGDQNAGLDVLKQVTGVWEEPDMGAGN